MANNVAIFRPFHFDPLPNPGWDVALEIIEYRNRHSKAAEVVYRDLRGRVHRTSTRYMRVY